VRRLRRRPSFALRRPRREADEIHEAGMLQATPRDPTRRSPGQYARETVERLRLRTLVVLGVLAVFTAGLGRWLGLHDARFIVSELGLLVTMFLISHYVLPLVERRDRGARGEESVGALLDELEAHGWHVFHDATLGHGNVDHIAIGPAGIFTVETKSHPGPIRVRRIHGAALAQANAHSEALERVTGLRAEPLLVYSRAWVDRPLARRNGVRVMPASILERHLLGLPERLSSEGVREARDLVARCVRERKVRRHLVKERWPLPL
jgi:Nuclease-related domain